MKAAILSEFGEPLELRDVPVPVPDDHEVLVRVHACGIDGTDLKLCRGVGYAPKLPFVMGHEFAGEVVEAGRNVSRFRSGDRVIPYIFVSPAHEEGGKHRDQMSDALAGVIGIDGVPGGYAEYASIPEDQLCPLPPAIDWVDGAVLCDGALTAYHAVDRARIVKGQRVAMIGIGGVGAFALQLAVHRGADVVAFDQTPEKLEWAQRLGACDGAITTGQDAEEISRRYGPVDCVMDFVGASATFGFGRHLLDKNSSYLFVGYGGDSITVSPAELCRRQLRILGTRGGSRADLAAVIQLANDGVLKSVVTDRYPLDETNQALAALAAGKVLGRCVLLP